MTEANYDFVVKSVFGLPSDRFLIQSSHTEYRSIKLGKALAIIAARTVDQNAYALNQSDFSEAHCCDLDLSTVDFTGARFKNAVFQSCRFPSNTYTGAAFSGATFINCDFSRVEIETAAFNDVDFVDCAMSGAFFGDTPLDRARFVRCDLTNADIRFCDMHGADLSRSHIESTRFSLVGGTRGIILPDHATADQRAAFAEDADD
ncbi:pentapeptide repeat-containing protein [Microvirga sesbaniae]|uniref:pentapeptide repeat-containing protein n=1 Tax=Microvirga sesbaniae TaxID=681392 RepID=UPI0021C85935|nr:pentapeptide repeat-containing protein [Microvirga sp. HBU67692]